MASEPADVLLYYDSVVLDHDTGPGHPERAGRLAAVRRRLEGRPVPGARWALPRRATRDELSRVHAAEYLDAFEPLRGRSARLDPDTVVSPASVDASLVAAGAAVEAVTAVMTGAAGRAFALVRPPGHHAEHHAAMGFCLLNNVAVAAAHARSALGCERVLVVDWDVHHGNGTQHIFEERDDVLVFNTHQYPFYPGTGDVRETGRGRGSGYTVNVPLPEGTGDGDYVALFRRLLAPVAESYRPDLLLVSAGFDAHRDDPLGGMRVTEEGFAALCGVVRDLADRHAGGRLALVLEGGYDLEALAGSVQACVEVLAGADPPPDGRAHAVADAVAARVAAAQKRYWRL